MLPQKKNPKTTTKKRKTLASLVDTMSRKNKADAFDKMVGPPTGDEIVSQKVDSEILFNLAKNVGHQTDPQCAGPQILDGPCGKSMVVIPRCIKGSEKAGPRSLRVRSQAIRGVVQHITSPQRNRSLNDVNTQLAHYLRSDENEGWAIAKMAKLVPDGPNQLTVDQTHAVKYAAGLSQRQRTAQTQHSYKQTPTHTKTTTTTHCATLKQNNVFASKTSIVH